jgi:hypothetical protein
VVVVVVGMANFCWSFASFLMALTTLVALVAFRKEPDIFRGPGDETDETFDCIRAFPPFLAMMSHEQT